MFIDESRVYDSKSANSLAAILELKCLDSETEPLFEPIWARSVLNPNGTLSPQTLSTLSSNVLVGCSPIPAIIR